jgi:hypothetical protein
MALCAASGDETFDREHFIRPVHATRNSLPMFFLCSKLDSMAGLIDTLGKAARHRLLVLVACRRCGREARFYAEELATHYGHGRDPQSLKFRCEGCKASSCRITLVEQSVEPNHEMIVWRPLRVKGR